MPIAIYRTAPRSCILVLLATALVLTTAPVLLAARESRPFWTEKSAFVEGDDLFVVGVASKASSVEEGRTQAFANGRVELMNYAQITNLEARGLVIETQMTYEESNADGSMTVYRLLKVPAEKLLEIQGRVKEESRIREQTIEKAIRDLSTVQQSFMVKQQILEEKTGRLERQQREVESLLSQLEKRFPSTVVMQAVGKASNAPRSDSQRWSQAPGVGAHGADADSHASIPDSLASRLESLEMRMAAREQELVEISRRAEERISRESSNYAKRCGFLVLGMNAAEVREIMGEPRKASASQDGSRDWWTYGLPVAITITLLDGYLNRISYRPPSGFEKDGCPSP